jgi:hypothetical protein
MQTKCSGLGYAVASCLLFLPSPALAQSSSALVFLQTIGCSQLPLGTCELLNPGNAENILLTYRSLLASKLCGSSNFQEAKQLLEIGDATDPTGCNTLLSATGVEQPAPQNTTPPPALVLDKLCEERCDANAQAQLTSCETAAGNPYKNKSGWIACGADYISSGSRCVISCRR